MSARGRFDPLDVDFERRIRNSFARQKAMALIGARLAPALGDLIAHGDVVKPGRTLTVARGEVYAADGRLVATIQQTLMTLAGTPDHR